MGFKKRTFDFRPYVPYDFIYLIEKFFTISLTRTGVLSKKVNSLFVISLFYIRRHFRK